MEQRARFSSVWVTLLTMAGVAIGLGNVWRFPYMMGLHGGSAFLIIYLVFALLIAVPALTAEWGLGRATRRGPVGALVAAFGPRYGRPLGLFLLAGILIIDSYYIVVVAQVTWSSLFSVVKGFSGATLSSYGETLALNWLQYVLALTIAALASYVVHRGLTRGIELVSRLFVPFFGLVIVYLVVHTLTLPGAMTQTVAFLRPDFSRIGPEQIFAAMGQAFYSVGLGGSIMLVYGSYIADETHLPRYALATVLSDSGAALLAGLFMVPAILVYGLDLTAGPGLIFDTLPKLFSEMPGGRVLGSLFLVVLTMVAFLSAIAPIEVVVSGLSDPGQHAWSRHKAVWVTFGLLTLLMLPSAFYPPFIGWADLILGSGFLLTGGLIATVALCWGLGRSTTLRQILGRELGKLPAVFFFWLRWIIPMALTAILVMYIHSNF